MNIPTARRLKLAALACLAIPIVVLAAFTIGEVAAGDASGLQHVAQLLPLAALAWLGWRQPRWGGILLIALSVVLTGLFVWTNSGPMGSLLAMTALLFAPPLLAGILFVFAGRHERD